MQIINMVQGIMKINTDRIRYEMKVKGWQIIDLANALELKERAVFSILQKQTTKLKTINKLGDVLDIDPKDLLH